MTAIVIHGLYRKKALLELIAVTLEGNLFVQNEGNTNDRWIIPRDTFESTYELAEPINGADLFKHSEFDFGIAVRLAKEGHRVARKGWNGAGMFVYYVPQGTYPARTEVALTHFGAMVDYNPYLAIKTVNGTVSTWVPSVNDCLAEDWTVL